jgi:hypothetical protein
MMLNTIKNSWVYIFFVIVVTVMITGSISLLLSLEKQLDKRIGMNTVQIYISQEISDHKVTNEDFLQWLEMQEEFVIYRDDLHKRFVFSHGWNKVPYNIDDSQIRINRWSIQDTKREDGRSYFYLDGIKYEVIGYVDQHSSVLAGLVPILKQNPEDVADGVYYLDAGERTLLLVQELENFLVEKNPEIDIRFQKENGNWIDGLFHQSYAVVLFGFCVLLLFLGSFNISSSWIEGCEREMFVRRLVGASEWSIIFHIYRKMLMIRAAAGGIGCIITFIIADILHLLPFKAILHGESIIIGIGVFLIMDFVYTFPILFINQRKKLIGMMR